MHEIARANASRWIARASSASAPVDAAIVAAPNAAGIAAAAKDWKTSSSAMNSSGSAMSSARWIADSELRVPSLDSSGMPVTVARTGSTVLRSTRRCAAALRRAMSARLPEIVSSSSALRAEGRSADCPDEADHGLSTRTPGPLGQRRDELPALALDVRARPAQEDRHGRRVAEVAADQRAGTRRLGVGDLESAGR